MKNHAIKYLPISTITFLLISCSSDNSYSLEGKIDVEDGTKIYVLQADQNNQPFIKDSASVKSKSFDFKGVSSTPQISYMQVEGINGYVLTILENGLINAEIYKDSISKSVVSGTKSNDDFIKYKSETKNLVDKMNSISFAAQDAIMNGDVETAMELEKDYNRLPE